MFRSFIRTFLLNLVGLAIVLVFALIYLSVHFGYGSVLDPRLHRFLFLFASGAPVVALVVATVTMLQDFLSNFRRK